MTQDRMTEIIKSSDLKESINKLSFEERLAILLSDLYVSEALITELLEKKIKLFNEEESVAVFQKYNSTFYSDRYEYKKILLLNLPDEFIVKEIINIESSYYEMYGYYLSMIKNPRSLLPLLSEKKIENRRFIAFLSDEDKAKLVVQRSFKNEKFEIIQSFKNEEYKIRFIYKLDAQSRSRIIHNLSDENIRKFIKPFIPYKGEIISGLSNDLEKEQYINLYKYVLSVEDKVKIIASFKDVECILRNLKQLPSEKARYLFLEEASHFYKEKWYIDLLLTLKNGKYIAEFVPHYYDNRELVKVLIDKIRKQNVLYSLLLYNGDSTRNSIVKEVLPRLSQKLIAKYIKDTMGNLSDYHFLLYLNDDKLLLKALEHTNFDDEYNDDMLPLFRRLVKNYNLNLEHLIKLAKRVGCSFIGQLSSENIQNTINLDDENFEKYLQLFSFENMNLNLNSLNTILNSILNRIFSIKYPFAVQIFIDTLHAIEDGNTKLAIEKMNIVLDKVSIDGSLTKEDLIRGVLDGNKAIIAIYNKMTYEYLMLVRNQYVNNMMPKALEYTTKKTYDKNEFVKYMLKILPVNFILYYTNLCRNMFPNLTLQEREIIQNEQLFLELINFKKNPQNGLNGDNKKYLPAFNNLIKNLLLTLDEGYLHKIKRNRIEGVKKEYEIKPFDINFITEIMLNIDVNKLRELVFNNPEIYGELLKYLSRYGIMGWGDTFSKIAPHADIDVSSSVIGSLISNFEMIYRLKKEKEAKGERTNLTSDLSLADCLDSDANVYSYLLGRENYRLIKRNPGPFSSPKNKKFRLDKAIDYLTVIHSRKYITVPPVDKNFRLNNGKMINIIIGNTNDTINLTYGERTGACMRIGGAASTLLDFCLRNENGFHISFNDPETGELISRVSCFRNGNTVFMNQLRMSLNPFYSNEEVKEACGLIGKEIIESTKNSKYPVLNVVASSGYAYMGSKTVSTNCANPVSGFNQKFYTDVRNDVVVVATSLDDLSPIVLGPSKAERYEVGRGRVRSLKDSKASSAIAQIEALDDYYSHKPLDEIHIEEKKVILAFVGEDWYVALTSKMQVIDYVQKNSRDSKKAREERNKYLSIIHDMIKYQDVEKKEHIR